MRKSLIIGGSALLAAAIPAIAIATGAIGMGPGGTLKRADVEVMVKEHFARADLNKDGVLTLEEIRQGMAQRRTERLDHMFEAMDTDKNGSISRAEFDAAHQDMMGHHGMSPHDGKPGDNGPHGGMEHGMGAGPMGAGQMGPGPMGHDGMGHDEMGRGPMRGGMMGGMGEHMFERADANKDGKVTLAEATAAALAHFDEVDTNKDKTITPEERRAFHEKMHAARKAN